MLNFLGTNLPIIQAPMAGVQDSRLTAAVSNAGGLGLDQSLIANGPGRQPFNAEMAAIVEEFQPAVVSFHFGLPAPALLQRMKAAGARVLSSATTVEEALWLERNGADAIIAQGLEEGGHRGIFLTSDMSTQVGTAFMLCPEATTREVPAAQLVQNLSHAAESA